MTADVCHFVKSGWNLARASESTPNRLDETATSDGYASDSALVRACVVGSPGAFDALMQRHQRQVYLVCYRFTSNHEDAADLSQEVFLRVHRGLAGFKGNAALSTWLYRIAVNVCLNHANKKRPTHEIVPERLPDGFGPSPIELIARQERSIRVRAAIAGLPDRQRITLILRVYQDLTHKEIAEVLGSSVGAVKANFFHALANMKKQLSNDPC